MRSHDGRNRVSTLNNQTSGSVNIAGYAYGYDRAGNVMQVTESYPSGGLSNRTITNSYDGVYRLLTEAIATTGGSTVTTTYVYDKGHNRTSKAVSGGATTTYVIGDGSNGAGANQIVSATTGGVTTDYGYDANGNRVSRIVPTVTTTGNLTSGSVTITGVASTTGLAVGLVAEGTGLAAGATVVSVGSASATAAGNTTSGSTTVSGLAGTTGIVVGTQVSGTGIPFGATVISVGSSSVTLSAAATATGTGVSLVFTTLTVTLSSPATATGTGVALSFGLGDIYSYDDENRLVNLNYQTGESGTGTYVYGYDYRTRRVARTEPGPVATHIVFDGGTSIIEYGTGGAARPNVEYVRGHDYGGGVGGLEYSVRSGTPLFNFYDSRGDVTTQTNGSGAVTFQTGYEAFGNQTVTTGSTPDRQKASTKEHDPTGLLNEGFRYRDPETGTFLTRDPLGFKAGPNMYTYVQQNPWTHFDPEGLDLHALHEFWAGMGDSFIGIGKGIAHAAMHPIATAISAATFSAQGTLHPIDRLHYIANAAVSITNATIASIQSGPRGQGQVMGNILAALAPLGSAGAAAKMGSNVLSKIGDLVASTKVENSARAVIEAPKATPKIPAPAPPPVPPNAAAGLPQMKGMGGLERDKTLSTAGFKQTKVSGPGNETWGHSDNSEVRVHPYGNAQPAPYKSANNAHLHKEDPAGNQLSDRGHISTDKNQTHIGLPNPRNLPQVRNRRHGS